MSFQIPKYLDDYLSSAKYRKPMSSFTDNSTYYSGLSWQWISYMQNVVRPCIAMASGAVDGLYGTQLSTATGMAIAKGAARLISGDKVMFVGDDVSCRFLSDIWAPAINFNKFVARAIGFMVDGGTSVIKWNQDITGKNTLSAFRIDRTMFSTDEAGNVTHATFFISLLSDLQNKSEMVYWLVEERKYTDSGEKKIVYKVFAKSGIENAPVLPSPESYGLPLRNLPRKVQTELKRIGVTSLNTELPLNARDGLGVWLLPRTATNSCIPDCPLGDPVLYGCMDALWSIDVVFSGSIIDVLNGEGKIIVPKQFLQETLARLQQTMPGTNFTVTTTELNQYHDDSFVYVMPSGFDKDKMSPLPVQFDIRADSYGKMLELYERIATVRAGFSPTSIFPYLTPDNSAKTATEVTAEENLTHASVMASHRIICDIFSRAVREILFQEGYTAENVQIVLSDYVGNKLQHDENIRKNYEANLATREYAIKQLYNLTDRETQEYIEKLNAEAKEREEQRRESMLGMADFNDKDYYGGGGDVM